MTTGLKSFLLCANLTALAVCLLSYDNVPDIYRTIGLTALVYGFWALIYTMFWYIDNGIKNTSFGEW